jgi:hypothetical protein
MFADVKPAERYRCSDGGAVGSFGLVSRGGPYGPGGVLGGGPQVGG